MREKKECIWKWEQRVLYWLIDSRIIFGILIELFWLNKVINDRRWWLKKESFFFYTKKAAGISIEKKISVSTIALIAIFKT